MADTPDITLGSCPLPLRQHERIVAGHGGGGKLSADLVEHLFLPAFGGAESAGLHDAATLEVGGGRLAFSTDSYVVQPLFFPGGSIGDLAVHGTVNDLAMAGARPLVLSTGFILEEGLPIATLNAVAQAMGAAARHAGVRIAAGDTKVVDGGSGAGLYINTAGVGVIPEGVDIRPERAATGDAVLVSGPIGRHGMAVMSKRHGLEFESTLESDTAPLDGLVQAMLAVDPDIHVLRDPTRGGLAATLCEIASAARVGIHYEEAKLPIPGDVAAACSFLGLDPTHVANEGCLVALVDGTRADRVLEAMRHHEHGGGATHIGHVVDDHPGMVTAQTALGATRVVDQPLGEQLPRIC